MDTDQKERPLSYDDFEYHRYCYQCGGGIRFGRQWRVGFDEQTREEIMHFYGICENYPRFPHPFHQHFMEEFDKKTMKMIDNYPY